MVKKEHGLTLLETLCVLAIAGVIITMAVRYFAVTDRDLQVTHAIQQIQNLTNDSYEWLQAQKQENFSASSPDATAISLQALINAGLIENTDANTRDPWGSTIAIAPGMDPSRVKITMPNVPQVACKNLARRLETVSKITMPNCNAGKNDYVGEF